MPLYVGTSGWSYREWIGALYPPGLPQRRFLEHYARELGACEINATFYRRPAESTLESWASAVPERFRFAIKAHRRVSYRRTLALDPGSRAFIGEFLSTLSPLGSKLGCILVQVPTFHERDDDALAELLECAPPGLPFACELQHESWWSAEVEELVAQSGATVCVRETEGVAPESLPPGPLAYLRLKGSHYPDRERASLTELLEREAREREVFVFARHKDVAADDPHTGLGLARWLTERSGASA